MKDIIVRAENQYGKTRYIPVNEDAAKLAKLMRQKTFTKDDVEHLKSCGYRVIAQAEEKEL